MFGIWKGGGEGGVGHCRFGTTHTKTN